MVEEPQGAMEGGLLELGQVLLHVRTVDQVLALVVDVAERLLSDAETVSITLRREDGPYTPHSTAAIAVDLDQVQYETDRGPCLAGDPYRHGDQRVRRRRAGRMA